jgi:hypothetical protein
MMTKRTPKGYPDTGDHPFKSLATGVVPPTDTWLESPTATKGQGMRNTFFCDTNSVAAPNNPALPRLFEVPGQTHPYRKYELMTKLYNNLTTRSNTFAVFLTMGFFEVTDESVSPPKLGAEIGKAENRHVRYRAFAIVDRTQLANMGPSITSAAASAQIALAGAVGPIASPNNFTPPPGLVTVPIKFTTPNGTTPMSGKIPAFTAGTTLNAPTNAYTVTLQPGMTIKIDAGAGGGLVGTASGSSPGETVVVTGAAANSITAYFTKSHASGAVINLVGPPFGSASALSGVAVSNLPMLGHPGPNPANYASLYTGPIPYYTIIEGK